MADLGIFSAVSAVAAAISLVTGAYKYWKKTEAEKLSKWQSVVVYAILSKLAPLGLTFEDIRSKYTEEVVRYGGEVPKEQLTDLALLAALMELLTRGLVTRDDRGAFSMAIAQPSLIAMMRKQEEAQRAGDRLLTILLTEQPKTPEQLRLQLEKDTGSSLNAFMLMASMVRQDLIAVQADGKLYLSPLMAQLAGRGA